MMARKNIIFLIIISWIMLFAFCIVSFEYLFNSNINNIEQRAAIENTNRTFQLILNNFQYMHVLNVDYAYWNETARFTANPNNEYINDNLTNELFDDNNLNLVIIFDKNHKVVWAKSFDPIKNTIQPARQQELQYFSNHAQYMLKNKSKFNNLIPSKHGITGFVQYPGSKLINFVAFNSIHYDHAREVHNGVLVFSRVLTDQYMRSLGKDFNYKIKLHTLPKMSASKEGAVILQKLKSSPVYIKNLNKNTLVGYRFIKDLDHKPIAILSLNLPRKIFIETQKQSLFYQILLLIISVLGVLIMSYIVHAFFKKQEQITISFERFVPHAMLALLPKKNILDVNLGLNTERSLSIMFLDIRNFTSISEKLTPKENFEFINQVLFFIAPIVKNNNGYIDKYIGDAVMAIFSRSGHHADDAVKTALAIQDKLEELNQKKEFKYNEIVNVGIGINTGSLLLGIIGAEERLSGTVVGDAVNLASRVESLTKKHKCSILITSTCLSELTDKDGYQIDYVSEIMVKGKQMLTTVYKVGRH